VVRPAEHISLALYRDRLLGELATRPVSIMPIDGAGPLPAGCDAVWDPGLGMRTPARVLADARVPIVVTLHGLRAFSIDVDELFPTAAARDQERRLRERVRADWAWLAERVAAVIAGSRFVASQLSHELGVPPARVHVSLFGVDHDVFRPDGAGPPLDEPYLLHVSTGEPGRKNTERVVAAHARLAADAGVKLVLRHPSHPGGDGVVVLADRLDEPALARWYRGARGLVFPSLYEGFGLPIVEAMASGCPVLTSTGTACGEVAGDAALLVEPRSLDAIEEAMRRLASEPALRNDLRARGLARVAGLSWAHTAGEHLAVLRAVIDGAPPPSLRGWTDVARAR